MSLQMYRTDHIFFHYLNIIFILSQHTASYYCCLLLYNNWLHDTDNFCYSELTLNPVQVVSNIQSKFKIHLQKLFLVHTY